MGVGLCKHQKPEEEEGPPSPKAPHPPPPERNAESPEIVTAVQEDQSKEEQQKTEIVVKENASGERQSKDVPAEHKPKKIRRRSGSPDPLREGILPRKYQEKGRVEENLVEYMCPFTRQVSKP